MLGVDKNVDCYKVKNILKFIVEMAGAVEMSGSP
jgi:hypothetical protein